MKADSLIALTSINGLAREDNICILIFNINENVQPQVTCEMATNIMPYLLQILVNISLNICKNSQTSIIFNA